MIHVGMPTAKFHHDSTITGAENKHVEPFRTLYLAAKKLKTHYIGKCVAGERLRFSDDVKASRRLTPRTARVPCPTFHSSLSLEPVLLHATRDAKEAHYIFVKIVTHSGPLTEGDTLGRSSSATVDVGATLTGNIADVLWGVQGKEGIR